MRRLHCLSILRPVPVAAEKLSHLIFNSYIPEMGYNNYGLGIFICIRPVA
jgi:hypothetical protein